MAARAARRRQLDPAQARGHGRPDPGRTPATRTSSTWPATSSPATASRPGSSPSTSAPPTGGSSSTSTACSRRRPSPSRSACPPRRSSSTATGWRASCRCRSTRDAWHNELVSSYRLDNGVLHNPVNDRRTTQGVFHVAEGGLPIPGGQDPRCRWSAYLRLLAGGAAPAGRAAAPAVHGQLAASRSRPWSRCCCGRWSARRCPKVSPEKRMEMRFFAPGGLVSNLDFVESIFGNAGDPYLPENDAGARRGPLDRPQRLRHPRAAPHAPPQEGPRPAARERGHRRAARGRHVLGGRGRALQRRPALQDHRRAASTA